MMLASRVNIVEVMRCRGAFNPAAWALVVSIALTGVVLIPGVGKEVNGAARWLAIGPISFQPSELVKWAVPPAVAWWCARRRGVMGRFWFGLVPAVLAVAAACGLIVIEDLGTAVLIASVAALLLLAGGAKLWQLVLAAAPGIGAFVLAIVHSPYRVTRLMAFLNPWADPQGSGYHPIQSMIAFATGGLTGKGLGNGVQKFGYLPEDTTDFIFASICEELGITGSLLVVVCYLVIIWVGLSIIRRCGDTFTRLVGLGVVLTIGLQALINLAVVTVLVPSKGIALPLISKGGTGWIVTAFAVGLLASLDYANDPAYCDRATLDGLPENCSGGMDDLSAVPARL